MANLTYAVADVHGRADCLENAIATIERHGAAGDGRRTIVFLGDYIDRGPGSRAVLDRLRGGPPPGWRWICLRGNHEDLMIRHLYGLDDPNLWIYNGGDATLAGFQRSADGAFEVPADYVEWLESLGLMHSDRYRIFVHAGFDRGRPEAEQSPHHLMWTRNHGQDSAEGKHIVHGHTPHADGPRFYPGRTNLDTLAWQTGRLAIALFDDDVAGGPQAILTSEVGPGRD